MENDNPWNNSTCKPLLWEIMWIIKNPHHYVDMDHRITVILNIMARYRRNGLIKSILQLRAANGIQRVRRYSGLT